MLFSQWLTQKLNGIVAYSRHITTIMAKLLTVFGATGQQGGALIDYVLETPQLSSAFRLRAVTRDATKPASVSLKEKGVEIVEVC